MPASPSWDPNGSYTVAFADDFTGTSLDTSKWHNGWFGSGISGPVNGAETAVYSSANVSVSGGYLQLLLVPVANGGHPNTGSLITTDPAQVSPGFAFIHGAAEARIFVPATAAGNQAANWIAWWINGPDGAGRGEFDVIEALHGAIQSHIPTAGNPGFSGPNEPYTGWHNFGVSWATNQVVTFYYDGVAIGHATVGNTGPMYLVLNNTVGTNSVAYVPSGGITMLVDWAYVWTPGGSPPPSHSGSPSTGVTITSSVAGSVGSGGAGGSSPSTGITITPSCTGTAVGGAPVALFYRTAPAITTSSGVNQASWSVTKQAGTMPGDWIFIWCYGGGSAVSIPGFTTLADPNNFSCLLYRRADGTEGATFALAGLYGVRPVTTIIATVGGAAAALDPPALAAPVSGAGATSIPVTGLTLANTGDWVLWFAGNQNGWAGPGYAITPPAGFTSQAANGATAAGSSAMLADNYSLGAGATGTETGTITASAGFSGVLVGLTPATSGAQPSSPITGITLTASAIGTAVRPPLPVAIAPFSVGASASFPLPAISASTVTVVLTSSQVWICPPGVLSVQVQCTGPGGEGAPGSSGVYSGAGGGGGEFAQDNVNVTPGQAYSVVCAPDVATVFPGDNITVTANAGGDASGYASPGAGGTGSTNTVHYNGNAGQPGAHA